MELFNVTMRGNKEVKDELSEQDLAFIGRYAYFYGRNKALGKKILNLLAQANRCTMSELIENWDRLYKR